MRQQNFVSLKKKMVKTGVNCNELLAYFNIVHLN